MKKFLKCFLSLISLSFGEGQGEAYAQNLVPNSGFEQYNTCPNNYSEIYYAIPWFQPNIYLGNTYNSSSSDYFNSCTTFSNVNIPINFFGYQQAYSGNAYAGIGWLYYIGNNDSYGREYLEVELDSTLVSGKKYLVSFYASLSNGSRYATDAIGVYFSNDSVTYNSSQFHYLPLIPKVMNPASNIISDTANWVLISGQYIASGGEKFITIGNFYPDSISSVDTVNPTGYQVAYYYIDDVSVVADTATGVGELQKENVKFKVYPNPAENEITVEYYGNIEQIMILNLYNLLGVKIGTHTFNKGSNTMKISLLNYESGIYFYKIISEDKLIKEDKLIIIKR